MICQYIFSLSLCSIKWSSAEEWVVSLRHQLRDSLLGSTYITAWLIFTLCFQREIKNKVSDVIRRIDICQFVKNRHFFLRHPSFIRHSNFDPFPYFFLSRFLFLQNFFCFFPFSISRSSIRYLKVSATNNVFEMIQLRPTTTTTRSTRHIEREIKSSKKLKAEQRCELKNIFCFCLK